MVAWFVTGTAGDRVSESHHIEMSHSTSGIHAYFWLILIAFVVALVARRCRVPYALALVITGLIIGVPHLLPQVHLDPELLLAGFLPPLLFESALHLEIVPLRADWKPIALYTLAGTSASTVIVGWILTWMLHLPFSIALVFGALISTTDPISVIAIFKRLGAGPRLTMIMEAESLFNNDTAVVLFTVILAATLGGGVSAGQAVAQFLQLVLGGALLGTGLGWLASRIHYELDDHLIEITLTTVVAFGAYLGAEAMHVSGVMAVVAAGLMVGNYGMPNTMSPSTRLAVLAFWEYTVFAVNSVVFLLIGIEVSYVNWTSHLGVVAAAIGAVLVGRAAIYPLSWLINLWRGDIPVTWQHVLYWGGLRGALSMALVLGLDRGFPQRQTLVAATFGVVLFSLLVQGLTVGPLLRRLGLVGAVLAVPPAQHRLAGEIVACEAALMELARLRAAEVYPNWSVEMLFHQYQGRLKLLEDTMRTLYPDHSVVSEQVASKTRRLALTAEKSALQDSVRRGWLSEADWRRLTERLDAELVELG